MKTMNFILGMTPLANSGDSNANGMNNPGWYLIGATLAVLLLAYLIYALIKPEKF
jgi:K+-transporting ATPase KdpF subunit